MFQLAQTDKRGDWAILTAPNRVLTREGLFSADLVVLLDDLATSGESGLFMETERVWI